MNFSRCAILDRGDRVIVEIHLRGKGVESGIEVNQDFHQAWRFGRAFYSPAFEAGQAVNFASFVFLDERAREFYADWERAARDVVAILRSAAGRDPFDRDLSDLVGELSTRSEQFRGHWATHNVRLHKKGKKVFNHPVVGELDLSYDRFELPAEPGLAIVAYTAEPGSRSAEALSLLASWAATKEARDSEAIDPSTRGARSGAN